MRLHWKLMGLRHPKTIQERRDSVTNGKGWTRPRRNKRNAPQAYDDIHRVGQRCWKVHRKTQMHRIAIIDNSYCDKE